ncbi:hypothetical protein MTR05_12755 [Staphylococcus agnetis]|uniref:hypothetical protein n=1 Tax=Staphylococcus agnetis TaxID=985762 RepID=UPI00208EEA3D|nr:hypothetical protein [Staphylococcus agnetis]MCO4327884.1 hypothetical protein [Staphylococcus agnetis]
MLAEEMKGNTDVDKKEKKKSKYFRSVVQKVAKDVKHSARVEEGSIVDGAIKLKRSLFPKK